MKNNFHSATNRQTLKMLLFLSLCLLSLTHYGKIESNKNTVRSRRHFPDFFFHSSGEFEMLRRKRTAAGNANCELLLLSCRRSECLLLQETASLLRQHGWRTDRRRWRQAFHRKRLSTIRDIGRLWSRFGTQFKSVLHHFGGRRRWNRGLRLHGRPLQHPVDPEFVGSDLEDDTEAKDNHQWIRGGGFYDEKRLGFARIRLVVADQERGW